LAQKLKKTPLPPDDKTPKRVAKEVHSMVKKNIFKNLLAPIVNDSAKSIEISPDRKFMENSAQIDDKNFELLLGENSEILPELENDEIVRLSGTITSLKSTRGDSLTFKYITSSSIYFLEVLPPPGDTTKNYTQYYKEDVTLSAKVERTSLYKKPKLRLIGMSMLQPDLPMMATTSGISENPLRSLERVSINISEPPKEVGRILLTHKEK
jgi:hypothetical protein